MNNFEGGDAWAEAFDLCREYNYPIRVIINGVKYKIYPSGRSENLETGEVNY